VGLTTLSEETRQTIRKYVVSNSLEHEGKARGDSVIGRILSEHPDLRPLAKEVAKAVAETVKEVNKLTLEQQEKLESAKAATPQIRFRDEDRKLPPLPNADLYEVIVTRFAPNPDGPLTFGHARAVVISQEYAVLYKGRFVIRFEDTDPRTKPPLPEAYGWIKEDLNWLGAEWQAEYTQSSRLEIYYSYAEKMISDGRAYVCTCNPQHFKDLVQQMKECPCRSMSSEEHLGRWRKMLNGEIAEGEAVVRLKTELTHPNPAVRDWPALRIINTEKHPHPLVGSKYRVWPLYNFSAAIDDHEMGVTHILRAKEHVSNTTRQEFLYRYMGWKYPEAIHFGMVLLPGTEIHKSFILKEIREGKYLGWDDPRLTTLRALKRRGILPETIRRFMLEIGAKPIEATLSWDNLYAVNRKLLDPVSKRYSFVPTPLTLTVEKVPGTIQSKIPYHVENPELGFHSVSIDSSRGAVRLAVAGDDHNMLKDGSLVRLMGLFNVRVTSVASDGIATTFESLETADAKKEGAPIIQWVKTDESLPVEVVMPDATKRVGLGEKDCSELRPGDIIQFLRFGFVRIDETAGKIQCFYAHK
jgi:glutamyl-tRNA synthetase